MRIIFCHNKGFSGVYVEVHCILQTKNKGGKVEWN